MRLVPLGVLVTAVLAGCGGQHHVFAPDGPVAEHTAFIGWFMVITAAAVGVLFYGVLAFGLFRRRRDRPLRVRESSVILAGGVVLPTVVVLTLTGLSLNVLNNYGSNYGGGGDVTIEVVGHQYWWEVRYPGEGFTTANEFHIPVGRRVAVTLRSVDVIHSFWLPNLAGKIDLMPGRTNHLVLQADEAGTYRGQCAEFCGLAHAQMIFLVTADPPGTYERWVRDHAADAATPSTPLEQAGLEAFMRLPCASCHTIRGTQADARIGPDLTHFASRETLGAGVVPNTRGNLAGWMPNSQTLKPGNRMPPIPMTPEELQALIAYMESLT